MRTTRQSLSLAFVVLALLVPPAMADSESPVMPARAPSIRYVLTEGSTLVVDFGTPQSDSLGAVEPPLLELPIRGGFILSPAPVASATAQVYYFTVRGLEFRPTTMPDRYWGHDGKGKYRLDRDSSTDPLLQQMSLVMAIDRCAPIYFDSGLVPVPDGIRYPWIDVKMAQVPGPDEVSCPRFTLHIVAVPEPKLWFSTETGFTSGSLGNRRVSDGDLLSSNGRVVRTNRDLLYRFRPSPTSLEEYGLDAVFGLPRPGPDAVSNSPQVWFSTETEVKTESPYGLLSDGDLLSDQGWVIRCNRHLISRFSPMPPIPDVGLDGVTIDPGNASVSRFNLLFSTEVDFFSERLGVTVGHGDLLHAAGRIIKTNEELMANFDPIVSSTEGLGLDAIYVWPNGEVWFSTEVGFRDERWGAVSDGDLLSDVGRVVMRNRDLMAPFEPLEDVDNFGLDAVWVARFESSGVLVRGVECVLFEADDGSLYVLEDYGDFGVGDRVWVSGILNPYCVTICMQGNGCIEDNDIWAYNTVPTDITE
jgi:hypothetical protein